MRARVIILLTLFMAGSLSVLGEVNPAGHWEGAMSLPGSELRMIVDLKQAAGALSGTISIPDQGLKGFALGSVKLEGRQLSFEMPNVPGTPTFTGTVSADGNSIEGTMSQGGGSVPFKLRRMTEAELAEAAKKAAAETAKKPDSVWEGTLNAGPSSLRLVVKVFKKDDGSLMGKLDSPDQGATDIAIPTLSLTDTKLSFELPAINGAFQGSLNAQKNEATGEWSQLGNSFPLTLKKVEKP